MSNDWKLGPFSSCSFVLVNSNCNSPARYFGQSSVWLPTDQLLTFRPAWRTCDSGNQSVPWLSHSQCPLSSQSEYCRTNYLGKMIIIRHLLFSSRPSPSWASWHIFCLTFAATEWSSAGDFDKWFKESGAGHCSPQSTLTCLVSGSHLMPLV